MPLSSLHSQIGDSEARRNIQVEHNESERAANCNLPLDKL